MRIQRSSPFFVDFHTVALWCTSSEDNKSKTLEMVTSMTCRLDLHDGVSDFCMMYLYCTKHMCNKCKNHVCTYRISIYIYIIQICNVSHTQSYSVKIKLCKSIEHILKNSNLISSPLAVRDLEVTLGIRTGTPSEVLRVWSCRGATCRSRRSAEFRRVPHKP